MNETASGCRSGAGETDRLLLPMGAFGPVFAAPSRTDRDRRLRHLALWQLAATVGAGVLILITAAVVSAGREGFVLFEAPVLFWGCVGLLLALRWGVAAAWVARHRGESNPVAWRSVGAADRLDAAAGPGTPGQLRLQAALASFSAILFVAIALGPFGAYPRVFGPLAALFAVQALVHLRVGQRRARRENERSNRECSA
ncbi:hypothetical protein [Halomonas denitrificans]|nr:hypothetical protein [Halomonas denitrificans]